MTMSIYLAGRYQTKNFLRKLADELVLLGHIVTSTWLYTIDNSQAEAAQRDMTDVLRANTLLSFTEPPEVGYNTGGRHVEFGIALASGKELILVGPRENLFHHFHNVKQFDSYRDFLEYIKGR